MSQTHKTLLAVSVLLNLLLAGFILGHACFSMMPADRLHETIKNVTAALPEEKRAHFEAIMTKAETQAHTMFDQLDAHRTKAVAALKAEPFNKASFLTEAKEMERVHGQAKQQLAQAIAEASKDLNAEQRAQVAEFLRRPPTAPHKTEEAAPSHP